MNRGRRAGCFVLLTVLLGTAGLGAQELLSGYFWWETEPFVGGVEYPQTDTEALTFLLEEARWVFSGMIYGFSFRYVPADSRRGIKTYFELELLGEIPWGDPGLTVISAWPGRDRYSADLGFNLTGPTAYYRDAWNSNIYPGAGGTGSAPVYLGFDGRKKAMEDAVRLAVHGYYRNRTAARPREIAGEVVFEEVPTLVIQEGSYVSRVRIRMNLEFIPEQAH